MTLPSELLRAIAASGGGQVVLVLGAGCSSEFPTSLPLARKCAEEAHRELRADGILGDDDCEDPTDLSSVADAVVAATGSQRDLVRSLPREGFQAAAPNEGHLIAAAMLREHALGCVMTLNFDLAMSSALGQVGAHDDVAIITRPEDHYRLGAFNLIYLHRNAYADEELWILTSHALEEGWRDGWEEIMATRVLTSPIIVFAGLGTPARVLLESIRRIRQAVPDGVVAVYQVDPVDREDSEFFAALDIPEDAYLQMGWGDFMRALASRLVEKHRAALQTACNTLAADESLDAGGIEATCERLANLGLIRIGKIRAHWLLDDRSYTPNSRDRALWLADLLLTVSLIEQYTDSLAMFWDSDGVVEFRHDDRIVGSVVVAHGRGIHRWLALETMIQRRERQWGQHIPRPSSAIVSGVRDAPPTTVAPPKDIASDEDESSIIWGKAYVSIITADELRHDPAIIERMFYDG